MIYIYASLYFGIMRLYDGGLKRRKTEAIPASVVAVILSEFERVAS